MLPANIDEGLRRFIRRRLQIRGVALVETKGHSVLAESVDISVHGVCLTLSHPLEVGSGCRLVLEMQREEKRTTSVLASVCFCLQTTIGYRIGLACSLTDFVE